MSRKTGANGWQEKSLDQLATLLGGGTPRRSNPEYFGTYIDWVTPKDLPPKGQVDVLPEVAEGLTKSGLTNSSAREIVPGSVLFSSRASIGKIAVTDRVCATNQGFVNFVPNKHLIDPWFLAYLLCYQTPAITRLAGKTTYKEVSRTKLRTFKVFVPPREEQPRIVERIRKALERWHEVCELRQQIHSEVGAVFPTLLADCFDTLMNLYSRRTLGQVSLETRYGTSRRCSRKPHGSPVLRIPNVVDGQVNLMDLKWCDQLSYGELEKLSLQDGDVLVVRTNGSRDLVGRCAVFEEQDRPFAYASYLIRIRPNRKHVAPQFLAFFLASSIGRDAILERVRTSAGQFNINSTNLRSILLPCPPLDVQRSVVKQMIRRRRVLNDLLAVHSDMQNEDVTLRRGILRKAFAGEFSG